MKRAWVTKRQAWHRRLQLGHSIQIWIAALYLAQRRHSCCWRLVLMLMLMLVLMLIVSTSKSAVHIGHRATTVVSHNTSPVSIITIAVCSREVSIERANLFLHRLLLLMLLLLMMRLLLNAHLTRWFVAYQRTELIHVALRT